jgi:hypothetical protein
MATAAYTEALERALGRVIGDAQRQVDTIRAQCDALVAQASARAAEAEAKAQAIEARLSARVDEFLAGVQMPRDGRDADPAEVQRMVAEAVAALPAPRDGKDADPGVVRGIVAEAVADAFAGVQMPRDGRDADPEAVRAMVAEAVAQLPAPRDGQDADPEQVRALVAEAVAAAVAEIPPAQDGKDADPGVIRALVAEAVAEIPAPKDGKDGKLPLVREWADRVHYAGECVTRDGGLWQALVDTGKPPPHADWQCLAARGRDGAGFVHRGTYSADADYSAGDVVMLNGSSWYAKCDNPGPCIGDDWGLMASRGSNAKGDRPVKLPPVKAEPVSLDVDGEGLVTMTLDSGKVLSVDLYPLLARLSK